ncbi:MAG TPA: ABC transporter permease [Oceanithermus profundus]|uniref:ABC transporter permease n=1 Tax=Oceanithermus profundus TaxID=187137 RepID=A0A7C5SS07_9DEIN|nr:ABC transporter permease [Oceanithermus profundus]
MASNVNVKQIERGESTWHLAWRRFRKHRMAQVSMIVIVILVAASLAAPLLVSLGWIPDPNEQPSGANLKAFYFLPPGSPGHLLGTDELGRDVFSRILFGGRISLLVGFSVAIVSVIIGTIIGALAGFFSGRPFDFYAGPFSRRLREIVAEGSLAAFGLALALGFAGLGLLVSLAAAGQTGGFWLAALLVALGVLALNLFGVFGAHLSRMTWTVLSWGLLGGTAWLIWDITRTLALPAIGEGGLNGALSTAGLVIGSAAALALVVWGLVGQLKLDLDIVISRLIDFMLSIPTLPLLLVLSAFLNDSRSPLGRLAQGVFGESASVFIIISILIIFGWITSARLVRGQILSLREQEFSMAAYALGASEPRIMFRHLVPNTLAPIIVDATLAVGTAILVEAALSFLGFGIQPPVPTWGNMLTGAQDFIFYAPHLAIYPGLMILITVLAFNYMGDGLRDALDPRSQL